ncbi:hypothetical protein H1R20_g1818, partial [Candolleomyces eurysporus]
MQHHFDVALCPRAHTPADCTTKHHFDAGVFIHDIRLAPAILIGKPGTRLHSALIAPLSTTLP